MKLSQVVQAGQEYTVYRVVGAQRILVELSAQRLRVLVQCQSKRGWMLPDQGSGVRFLNGVLREVDGSWVVACGDLAELESIASCLPAVYHHLLTPDSDDWQLLRGKKAG